MKLKDQKVDRQQLAASHVNLAKNIANNYAKRGLDYDECKSCAYYILVKAAQQYNPDLGFEFSTYFTQACYNTLLREYRAGKLNRPTRKKIFKETSLDINTIYNKKNKQFFEHLIIDREIDDEYINLSLLKSRQQQVIRMYYWEDKLYKEIGKELNLSTQRVQQIHSSAIQTLRRYYKGRLNAQINSK